MMREYEAFCDVQVLAFCVMSNHFHVLVEVPPKQNGGSVAMTDEVFLAKIKAMYSPLHYRDVEQLLERLRKSGADKAALELKAKYTCRMHDFSEFMKGLMTYNRTDFLTYLLTPLWFINSQIRSIQV
jgi:hypothetical protein